MAPRIAIIIPNWNGREITAECIRSLLAMDSSRFEILIVDNGSTDGSVEILRKEFPVITVLPQSRNLGFAGGCNVGICHALSQDMDYLLLLNNDTFVAADFVREMLKVMQSDPRIGAVCPKIYFVDRPRRLWYAGGDFSLWTGTPKHRGWKAIDTGQFDHLQEITQATGCAMLVRCRALLEVGLLDEQFWAYVEDLEWSVRFRQKGYRLAFAPKACMWHHDGATAVGTLGSGSQSVRQFLSTRNMIFLARKHLNWWQVPSYALGFLINHIAFYTALRLWRRDFKALFAIYKGLSQGLRMPLDAHTTELCGEKAEQAGPAKGATNRAVKVS
jgi:GT2 family glycosyltransferase